MSSVVSTAVEALAAAELGGAGVEVRDPSTPPPPRLQKSELEALACRLRRDLGVHAAFGAAALVLMGLAVPVRVSAVDVHEAVVVKYEVDGVCGPLSLAHRFPPGPLSRADSDLMTAMAPALAVRDRPDTRVEVSPGLRAAWKHENVGAALVGVRREWLGTKAPVPSLHHIGLANGATLEDWLAASATADEAAAETARELDDLVGGARKRMAELSDLLETLDPLLHAYKRRTLNAWRVL